MISLLVVLAMVVFGIPLLAWEWDVLCEVGGELAKVPGAIRRWWTTPAPGFKETIRAGWATPAGRFGLGYIAVTVLGLLLALVC